MVLPTPGIRFAAGSAASAAHASERIAAPLTTWLAGRSGKPLDELNAAARLLAAPRSELRAELIGAATAATWDRARYSAVTLSPSRTDPGSSTSP